MPPAIETEDLRKDYGDLRALDDVSLTVEDGELFGLLGPNGAGKTTFISILVGLVRKSGGRAAVFGHDVVDDYREARDAIGLAPQEFNVDRFFPIEEVLMHKAGYHGIPKAEARERAKEALRTVGIYDKRDQRFDWLSGGMKRRLILARALVTDPDLLILDEPTAGVDVELRHDIWSIVRDLNEQGTTILLTTHYIEEAERLCDRVAILDHGSVVTVETPDELMRRGTDTIYVGVEDEIETVPTLGPYALDTWLEAGRLAVQVEDGGRSAPELLEELRSMGFDVVDLELSRTSLEDVFVELTERSGGSSRDAAVGGDASGDASGDSTGDADGDATDDGSSDDAADDSGGVA